MYSFCAMYSLRMSFCSVPEIFLQSAPCFSATARYIAQMTAAGELMVMEVVTLASGTATARYIAQMTAAGELMVMEVVTLASGILSKSTSMSARELMATPHFPTSPSESG